MNARMAELKRCFEGAGFTDVKTVLSSGNVVFDARARSDTGCSATRIVEAAQWRRQLDRAFSHKAKLSLPLEADGVRILVLKGREVFTAYVPNPRGPAFMALIEKTFGVNVTTRTLGYRKEMRYGMRRSSA